MKIVRNAAGEVVQTIERTPVRWGFWLMLTGTLAMTVIIITGVIVSMN